VLFIDWIVVKFIPNHGKTITIIAISIICFISAYSLYNGLKAPVVKKVSIYLKNLPEHLTGFSIVHLSDIHLEPFKSKKIISSIVDTVNEIKADLIVITGDLIEGDINNDSYFVEELKKLKAKYGVIAVTGNHEFYAGIRNFEELSDRTNIKILRNEMITAAGSLQIIGLDDDDGRRFDHNGPDLDSLIPQCDPSKPIILLYHRPTGFDKAVEKGVDLQLSGHAHAGQIPPIDIIVHLIYKYPSGLYEKNGSYIYTSPGTGYWGPPMRFLSKSEITHIRLKNTK
jgi:predicted MPP superfamily phosphohydrolase